MNKSRIAAFVVALCALAGAPAARAAVLIDPYFSVANGTWGSERTRTAVDADLHGNTFALGYGVKLAWSFSYFVLGGEYSVGSAKWQYTKVAGWSGDDNWRDVNANEAAWGPFIGIHNHALSRFLWVSYFVSDRLAFDADVDPNEPNPQYSGTSMNIGAAITLGKHVKIGVEYRRHVYNKLSFGGNEFSLPSDSPATGTTFYNLKHDVFFAFISIPFTIGAHLN